MAIGAVPPAAQCLLALLAGLALFYIGGRAVGIIDVAGYETAHERQLAFYREGFLPIAIRTPVRLREGDALRAEFRVDARHGSLALRAGPVFSTWTPELDVATTYVEGARTGAMLFVAQAAGTYWFESDPTAVGGPRCAAGKSLRDVMIPDGTCPTYDVRYSVVWRYVRREAIPTADGVAARLTIPRLGEDRKYVRVRH